MSTLMELLEKEMKSYMDFVAVVYDGGYVKQFQTYSQLFKTAEIIADVLKKDKVDMSVIAVCRETDHQTPAILCGILKSGCAFYCFDEHGIEETAERLHKMNVRFLLIQADYAQVIENLMLMFDGKLIIGTSSYLSSLGLISLKLSPKPDTYNGICDIAYCITTSGSTGQRKLVQVPHSCIIPNITHIRNIYDLKSDDLVMLCSPLTFDPSIVEIFVTLLSGACLLILPDDLKLQSKKLLNLIYRRNKVTVIQATPSLIQRLAPYDLKHTLLGHSSSLRILALGGEEFPPLSQIHEWRAPDNKTQFINLYGITEVSCWSFYHCLEDKEIWDNKDVPLGKPLAKSEYKILGEDGMEILQGEGKLYLGGHDRQCLTDDGYCKYDNVHKFRDSGDLVRIDRDGRIIFIGRKDRQVKRNGCRLHLGEIEKIAIAEPSVSECKAVMKEGRLFLFVVPKLPLEIKTMKDYLQSIIKRKLPKHYSPDDIILVDGVPITKHGKCDFNALLSQTQESIDKDGPQISKTTIKDILKEEWKKLLKICVKTEDSNFLLSGGDSFSAVNLARAIEDRLELSAPDLVDVILHKSFSDIVSHMEKLASNSKKKSTKRRKKELEEEVKISINKKICLESYSRLWKLCSCMNSAVMRGNQYFCMTCMNTVRHPVPKVQIQRNKDSGILGCNLTETFSTEEPGRMLTPSSGSMDTKTLAQTFSSVEITQRWSFDTGKCVDASPLVIQASSGLHEIFIGSHSHHMYALAAKTGALLWKTKLGDRIESSACVSLCGKYIIVGCYDGGVYTLARDTGDIIWMYRTKSSVKSSPAVDPITGWIYIGSHDHHVYSLNIENQVCCWKAQIDGGSVFSSPALSYDNHYVCVCSLSGHVAALHPKSGEIIWKYSTGKPLFSSPTITTTGPCVGCVDGKLYQLDHQGCLVWSFTTSAPIFSSPVQFPIINPNSSITDPAILVGSHDNNVYCVSSDGTELWRQKTTDFVYSTCFCFGNVFENYHDSEQRNSIPQDAQQEMKFKPTHTINAFKYCVVTSKDGTVTVIETRTGQMVGSFKLPWEVFSSPVVIGNLLVVGCRDNNVYCLNVSEKQ